MLLKCRCLDLSYFTSFTNAKKVGEKNGWNTEEYLGYFWNFVIDYFFLNVVLFRACNGWNRDEHIRQSEMNRQRKTARDNIKDKNDANYDNSQLQVITGCRHEMILSQEAVTHTNTHIYTKSMTSLRESPQLIFQVKIFRFLVWWYEYNNSPFLHLFLYQ